MDIPEKIIGKLKVNFLLAPLTTFKIGGNASYYLEVSNQEELSTALAWAEQNDIKYFFLGGGSNILVSDAGYNGLVLKMNYRQMRVQGERIRCGAGDFLPQAVRTGLQSGLTGLEWSAGIPGTVGGAVRGNAGAFGQSISDNVENVEVYDINKRKTTLFSKNDCHFDYRHSIFKDRPGLVIWEVILKLNKGASEEINKRMLDNFTYRLKSQPKLPSAGSIFKNMHFTDLQTANPELAQLAEKENRVKGGKVGAGWVIGQLDISGKKIGNAKISLEHNNFIVNTGGATADDVVMLISYIKMQVRDRLGVQLNEEITYVGFD